MKESAYVSEGSSGGARIYNRGKGVSPSAEGARIEAPQVPRLETPKALRGGEWPKTILVLYERYRTPLIVMFVVM